MLIKEMISKEFSTTGKKSKVVILGAKTRKSCLNLEYKWPLFCETFIITRQNIEVLKVLLDYNCSTGKAVHRRAPSLQKPAQPLSLMPFARGTDTVCTGTVRQSPKKWSPVPALHLFMHLGKQQEDQWDGNPGSNSTLSSPCELHSWNC